MLKMDRGIPWLAAAALGLALTACDTGAEAGDAADDGTQTAETVADAGHGDMDTAAAPVEGLLNPNTAGEDELARLSGMTLELASALVAGRPHLDMLAVDRLLAASLDETARETLYRELWVPINLNAASEQEILLIPGVGDRMAHEFEEYRPYVAMAQFRREIGKYVDDSEVERLAGYVFVPIDLNEASDEDILAIPGVGDRMLHEFKEYRPYTSMAQFRREIGKYVDDAELARLERYVMISQ